MKLTIKKKAIKSLSMNKDLKLAYTPRIAGAGWVLPSTMVHKGCPIFSNVKVHTSNNPR